MIEQASHVRSQNISTLEPVYYSRCRQKARTLGRFIVTSLTNPCHVAECPPLEPSGVLKLDQSPTYNEFLSNHLINNTPVLIGKDLVELWPAFRLWKGTDDRYDIDWDYLVNTYGTQIVPVTNCRTQSTDPCTESITLSEVIKGWLSIENDDTNQDLPLLYVKDWHLARWVSSNPAMQPFYTTPHLFADDWLNYHYCTFTDDDFRFVYLGIQGTFTPFHKDVYDSYSWSTNVVGRKLWTFWAPNNETRKRPGIELVQEAGETVFVYVVFLSSDRVSPLELTIGPASKVLVVGSTPSRT